MSIGIVPQPVSTTDNRSIYRGGGLDALSLQNCSYDATVSPDNAEKRRLSAFGGVAALSLDAMASVAYGPEAIVLVLAAAGSHGLGFTLPVSAAIVVLLAVLVASYRQLIAAFPDGGGAYAVARRHLGDRAALIAAASLVIDYILNVAVSVAAGTAALTSAIPAAHAFTLEIALGVLFLVTVVNLRGISAGAKVFAVPTVIFVVAVGFVIVSGLIRAVPDTSVPVAEPTTVSTVGVLLLLKAFAAGCSALTGVEAIANATPEFRRPRIRRAQRAELTLGVTLGMLMLGIAALIHRFDIRPRAGVTVLAQVTEGAVGHGMAYYVVQSATVVLLALAANTSFGGLPQLMNVVAADNYLPHRLTRKSATGVHREGVLVLAGAAAVLLVVADGAMNTLVPLFAIGVFIGFTIAQIGLVTHWSAVRGRHWRSRAVLNGFGALLTGFAAITVLAMKASEGSLLVVVLLGVLTVLMTLVRRRYRRDSLREHQPMEIGRTPILRRRQPLVARGVVLVPVAEASLVSVLAIRRAQAFGREIHAIHVFSPDEDREEFATAWRSHHPTVRLVELDGDDVSTAIVHYVRARELDDDLLVVVADTDCDSASRILCAGRAHDLTRAISRDTDALVARIRLRIVPPRDRD
ncbi:APC family permease [Williamsia sterculiae]|uniref:Amino acid transporter n=1 Tax=Williamsia sterculiae TaxID=1344003 RepID=A0A1N7HGE7_9NOCA|nr:APC family permease [Williamsia sterculiae]SIS23967.1 Amino acid transporter [Williamsia sterculiae]